MATLPTPDENARVVLAIFAHFQTRAREVLRPNNFVAIAVKNGIRTTDIADGLKYGTTLGWFEEGLNGSIRLTDIGFAEMPNA